MRNNLTVAIILLLGIFVGVPEALNQIGELRCVARQWANLGLSTGLVNASAHDATNVETKQLIMLVQTEQSANEFRWHGQLAQGRSIEIKGINGNVSAEPASGNEVEVVAAKRARRSDPGGVQVQVIEHAGGVTICAVYPSPDSNKPNRCDVGSAWNSHVNNNDVNVNFTVRVPQGIRFVGRTINGQIETGALGSDVEAYTVNGSIKLQAAGFAQANTVNGSITATVGKADWSNALEFETVNGGITLDLPAGTNTEVEAETVNGDIMSDFPLTVQGRFSRKHLNGTIGSGGRQLKLKTVNGNVQLRRAS
jgi:hypothetical protein